VKHPHALINEKQANRLAVARDLLGPLKFSLHFA